MSGKKIIILLSAVAIIGASIYYLSKKREEQTSDGREDSEQTENSSIATNNSKLQFFNIQGDLSKSIYAKWRGDDNIYPVTRSLALQNGVDQEFATVMIVPLEEFSKYKVQPVLKEGEIPKPTK